MALNSMTGFARVDGSAPGARWHWEIRSVNGRGLDVRLKLPPGLESLETRIREAVQHHFTRGTISILLVLQRDTPATEIRINEAALAQVVRAAERVRALTGGAVPSADGLLALRGVLETVEPEEDPELTERLNVAILKDLDTGLKATAATRAQEGLRLSAVLGQQIDEMARLIEIVRSAPARTPDAIRRRLEDQVQRLIAANASFDVARLHQEAVLLATRTDVEEEIQRLTAHISAARELLADSGPAGRKLDFLAQEFNREANTLTSKAIDHEISRAGLALKAIIDQMREQVQNIE